jgi:molybdate transport system substrate-binding protein
VKVACEVPARDGPPISYPTAAMKEAKQPEAAKRFLEYLDSNDAAKIFVKFGFIVRK